MKVPISGQVTGQPEADNVMQVAHSQSYGGFIWTDRFAKEFANYVGARFAVVCNSGSSANLLALAALELPKGSEAITTALNFPTTVANIIHLGLVPVFVDSDPHTLTARWPLGEFDESIQAGIVVHILGNPSDVPVQRSKFFWIEDCCDALGSAGNGRKVGLRGTMDTASFYPAHHMTMGEGGAIWLDSPRLKKVIESLRDWGRDCERCDLGQDQSHAEFPRRAIHQRS